MKRMQGFCFINKHKCIIAFRKHCRNVIPLAFEFRMVYHTNGTMTTYLLELIRKNLLIEDQELITAHLMENILPTAVASAWDFHTFHGRAPGFTCDDTAAMGTKPNEYNTVVSELLARELTDIEHPSPSHIRIACIANVGVMCPDNSFCVWTMKIYEAVERFHHM